jgi:hypothetical protein
VIFSPEASQTLSKIFLHLIKFSEGFAFYFFLPHLYLFILVLSKVLILN